MLSCRNSSTKSAASSRAISTTRLYAFPNPRFSPGVMTVTGVSPAAIEKLVVI